MPSPLRVWKVAFHSLATVALLAALLSQAGCLSRLLQSKGQQPAARDTERGQAGEPRTARAVDQGAGSSGLADVDPIEQSAPTQSRAERQRHIEELVTQAMTAPQLSQRTVAALRASDKAIAPLADTVAAIEAAERIVVSNLSNADTIAYKAARTATSEGRDVVIQLDMSQGSVESTGRSLDVAIQGEGFFQVHIGAAGNGTGGGGIAFTRNGNFFVNKKGDLVLGIGDGGYKLIPPISIPSGATEVSISLDGTIDVLVAGQAAKQQVGRLMLSRFINPFSLRGVGGSLYVETEASGPPIERKPDEAGTGTILQGFLERSNVDLDRERFRLRFLHKWRETIFRAIDGDPWQP